MRRPLKLHVVKAARSKKRAAAIKKAKAQVKKFKAKANERREAEAKARAAMIETNDKEERSALQNVNTHIP